MLSPSRLRLSFAACVLVAASFVSAAPYAPAPTDPDALAVTRDLYTYLATRREQTTQKMIAGQHLGGINEIQVPGQFDITLHQVAGRLPAMVGTRYDSNNKLLPGTPYTLTADFCTQLNQALIAMAAAYHPIIHVTAVPPNPWNPQSGREPYQSSNNIAELLLSAPSSPAKAKFWAEADIIAGGLAQLQAAGIPVLFRPLAEFNQTNKYYYANQTSANFVALWKDLYTYYTSTKHLHNLLFCWEVWALNRNAASADIAPWYPEGYVDVVAGAFYFQADQTYVTNGVFSFSKPNDQAVYDYLTSRDRPFGAAQWGLNQDGAAGTVGDARFTLAFMTYVPSLAFAYYWTQDQAFEAQANAVAFVNDPRVVTVPLAPTRIVNLSVLTKIDAGETFTVGFVVGGAGTTGTKPLFIRAAGPSLTPYYGPGTLPHATLQYYNGSTLMGSNDGWAGAATLSAAAAAVGAFPFASPTSLDSAISLPALQPGLNSVVIGGSGTAGAVLAELYDATAADTFTLASPRLTNVSVLKKAGDFITLGFVISGAGTRSVLVRAVGATLAGAPYNVAGTMSDPKLTLYNGKGTTIGANDDWGGTPSLTAAFSTVGAFALPAGSKDAAYLASNLAPDAYTVRVTPSTGATGNVLVEVYEMP